MSDLIISDKELDEMIGFQIFAKPQLAQKIRKHTLESELEKMGIFKKVKPVIPEGYADHLSGNWNYVPDWAIARINFLENVIEWDDKRRCPKMDEMCPDVPEHSCGTVKHCYSHLCHGSCGHNEIWVSDKQKELLKSHPDVF